MAKFDLNPLTGQFDEVGGSSSGGVAIGSPITGSNPDAVLITDNSSNLSDSGSMTNGQVIIGRTGNTPVRASLTGTANQVIVTGGSGSVTLSTPQNINTTSSPTFAGLTVDSLSGVIHGSSGVLSASNVLLGSEVTGILPIANGGTNSSTALNNNRVIISNAGTIAEASAITANRALASDGSGIPAASATTNTELGFLSGVTSSVQTQLDAKIPLTQKGANNGVATLDGGGKIPVSQLPSSVMEYQGNWDASTNTPTLADGTGSAGDVYRVNVAGTQNLGSGPQTFAIGDWVVYSGTIWQKSINSNAVVSVNGQTGVVVLSTTDIAEGTNLYFTTERAQDAVGAALANTTTVALTYNDPGNAITADVQSNSITNTQINSAAAISLSKLAALSTNKALQSDGSGVISASTVTSTELGFVSGVTSSIQTQIDGKANTTLSNLTSPTAINQNLIPGGTFNLGTNANPWSALKVDNISRSSSQPIIQLGPTNTAGLFDATPVLSVDWANRQLTTGATIKLDWSGTNPSLNSHKLTNVTDPTLAQDAATKNYIDTNFPVNVAGDIQQTSFSGANNVSSPADVTGFVFSNGVVRSFKALVSVFINATASKYEVFELIAVQRAADWSVGIESNGDASGVVFSITNAGQIQYTSPNSAGFVALTMKFRAITTSV